MKTKKKILKKACGKGGIDASAYKQANAPINLLHMQGNPPTAMSIPKTKDNYLGK